MKILANRVRRNLIAIVALLLFAIVVIGTVAGFRIVGNGSENIIVIADFGFDASDKRQLTSGSDNIFVGRVMEREATQRDASGGVWTLFSVQVDENIKGSLSGTVTVRQAGGYDEKYGVDQVVNDDPLLQVGEMYLFATIFDEELRVHTTYAKYGNVHLGSQEERARLVAEFEEAVRNEIVDPRSQKPGR